MTTPPEFPRYSAPLPHQRMMNKHELKSRFDTATAAVYTNNDPVFFPEYDTVFKLLTSCVVDAIPHNASIIDIGAGTGNLSLRLMKQCDNCSVTLLDFSENMLSAVPEVLKDYAGRYTTVCADFATADFLPQSFDAIISSFAIHHSRGIDEYCALYSKFKSWLKPGGIFACLDVVSGSTAHWTALNENGWRTYLSQHFDSETIEHIIANHHVEDSPLALPEHCESLLRVAGFAHVDILWKRYNFALYCAQL